MVLFRYRECTLATVEITGFQLQDISGPEPYPGLIKSGNFKMEAQFEDTMEYYQFTNIVSIQKRPFPRREINLVMNEKLPINSAYICNQFSL